MKDLRNELIKYGKLIYSEGLVIGSGGNISARRGDTVYVKASGVSLGEGRLSDYNEIDLKTGRIKCFKGPCSIEIPMHIACYRARPDVGAVIHVHPVFSTAAGMTGKKLKYISYEFMVAMGSEVPIINYKKAGSLALAEGVKKAIKKHNGILLKNHGIIVVGKNLHQAYIRALALERACRTYLFSKYAKTLSFIPKAELKRLSKA